MLAQQREDALQRREDARLQREDARQQREGAAKMTAILQQVLDRLPLPARARGGSSASQGDSPPQAAVRGAGASVDLSGISNSSSVRAVNM